MTKKFDTMQDPAKASEQRDRAMDALVLAIRVVSENQAMQEALADVAIDFAMASAQELFAHMIGRGLMRQSVLDSFLADFPDPHDALADWKENWASSPSQEILNSRRKEAFGRLLAFQPESQEQKNAFWTAVADYVAEAADETVRRIREREQEAKQDGAQLIGDVDGEFARSLVEVQEAHDLIEVFARGDVRGVITDEKSMTIMRASLGVLCWLLGHGKAFAENMDALKTTMRRAGVSWIPKEEARTGRERESSLPVVETGKERFN